MSRSLFLADPARLFLKRANLALLFLGFLFWWLIRDYTMLALCLFLEIWYLSLSIKQGPLSQAAERTHVNLPKILQDLEWGVILSFLVVLFGILFLFLYRAERILMWGSYVESQPERLEIAAAFGDVVLSTLYYLFVLRGRRRLISGIWLLIGWGLTWGALRALYLHRPIPHLWILWGLALCNFVAGFVIARLVDDPIRRQNIRDTALYAELPTVVAFPFILFICQGLLNMEGFVTGAVAFQFFSSSVLLFFIESRVRDIIPSISPNRRIQGFGESAITFQFADVYETSVATSPLPATDYRATELVDADPVNDDEQRSADSVVADEAELITWQFTTVYEIPAGNEPALGDPEPVSEEAQFSTQSVIEAEVEQPGGEGE